jgi:hypothetical protein
MPRGAVEEPVARGCGGGDGGDGGVGGGGIQLSWTSSSSRSTPPGCNARATPLGLWDSAGTDDGRLRGSVAFMLHGWVVVFNPFRKVAMISRPD